MEEESVEEYFIKLAASFNAPSPSETPTLFSTFQVDDKKLKKLIDDGEAQVNEINEQGITPTWCACYMGNQNCLKLLLDAKGDPNISDCYQQTPIFVSAYQGSEENITLLLKHNASIYQRDALERTPLHAAAEAGNSIIIKILLAHEQELLSLGLIKEASILEAVDYEGKTALHFAAANNQCDCIDTLISAGASLDKFDKFLRTPLHLASGYKYDYVVDILIDEKANLELKDTHGRTALHISCTVGATACVDLLAANGANLSELDGNGLTPLHLAVLNSHVEIVSLLLDSFTENDEEDKNTIDPNVVDKEKRTAMHAAAEIGSLEICNLLFQFGTEINSSDVYGRKPIHYCGMWGGGVCLQWFLENGVLINELDNYGRTPLHYACYFGNTAMAESLLAADANPNISDKHGDTPLLCAYHEYDNNDKSDVIELLFNHGANPLKYNKLNRSALHICAATGYIELLQSLYNYTSNYIIINQLPQKSTHYYINIKDEYGLNALHFAIANKQIDNLEFLLKNGGDINSTDSKGNSLFIWACFVGCLDCIELLLDSPQLNTEVENENGISPFLAVVLSGDVDSVNYLLKFDFNLNHEDNLGRNALHLACFKEDLPVIQTIVSSEPDLLNRVDKQGRSCIFRACFHENIEIIEYLKEAGANLNIQDKNGVTPLMVASFHKNTEIVDYLLANGADMKLLDHKNRSYLDYLNKVPSSYVPPSVDTLSSPFNIPFDLPASDKGKERGPVAALNPPQVKIPQQEEIESNEAMEQLLNEMIVNVEKYQEEEKKKEEELAAQQKEIEEKLEAENKVVEQSTDDKLSDNNEQDKENVDINEINSTNKNVEELHEPTKPIEQPEIIEPVVDRADPVASVNTSNTTIARRVPLAVYILSPIIITAYSLRWAGARVESITQRILRLFSFSS